MTMRTLAIVGAGLAGAKAAEGARAAGFDGRVVLIGEEPWANALNQGTTAGRNAAGRRDSYSRLPYFFSDQYDLGMEYVGHSGPDDAVVVRGDTARREFIAFWHDEGVVTAAMNVNVLDVVDDLKALIEAGRPVDPARLADPGIPISELVSSRGATSTRRVP